MAEGQHLYYNTKREIYFLQEVTQGLNQGLDSARGAKNSYNVFFNFLALLIS